MRDGDADVKVQMLCAIAGEADVVNSQPAFGYARGQIVDVAPALAAAWIASRTAQTVASDARLGLYGKFGCWPEVIVAGGQAK